MRLFECKELARYPIKLEHCHTMAEPKIQPPEIV